MSCPIVLDDLPQDGRSTYWRITVTVAMKSSCDKQQSGGLLAFQEELRTVVQSLAVCDGGHHRSWGSQFYLFKFDSQHIFLLFILQTPNTPAPPGCSAHDASDHQDHQAWVTLSWKRSIKAGFTCDWQIHRGREKKPLAPCDQALSSRKCLTILREDSPFEQWLLEGVMSPGPSKPIVNLRARVVE